MRRLFYCFIVSLLLISIISPSGAQECNEGDPQLQEICLSLNKLQEALQMSIEATKPLEKIVADLKSQIDDIQERINREAIEIKNLERNIFEREVDLSYQHEVFKRKVRNYYKRSRVYSPLLIFLSSETASQLTRELVFRQAAVDEDKRIITSISKNILELENDKKKLKEDKKRLAALQEKLDKQKEFFEGEIRGAKAYQEDLSSKITELTAKQRALLAEKTGTFQTSVGEVPPADDPNSRPDFDPGFRPAFAAFSFGAPHRKGMSQYGAFGRAKAGQNYETILKAYYGDVRIERRDLPTTISTAVGTLPFEENYMLGIAEMPSKWGDEGGFEALKTQAIAARSYAIRAGKPICVSEHCQVYRTSKAANPPEAWRRAVEETRGVVVVSNTTNDVVSTWYASTAGGYVYSYSSVGHTTPGIWDTSCGSKDCWTNEAWEKKAGSPWFYKGWYKSRSGKNCGCSHPWLNEEEFSDILNAVLVYTHDRGTIQHLSQLDAQSCWGEVIPETWSKDQLRSEAAKHGGPINNINSITVNYSTGGYTQSVNISTDKGNLSFSGDDFKLIFNLRGPGVIHLKSELFNIEKK